MKIQFIKKHLDHKEGDTLEVTEGAGDYLIAVGAAKEVGKKEKAEAPQKETKAEEKTEKNKAAGPGSK